MRVGGPALWLPHDPGFPGKLLEIRHPPERLWSVGDRSVVQLACVAIVGTRRMTDYGERIARRLAAAFARAGACVVSGLARGIDTVAHRTALDTGGRTIAVLATGVDVACPVANRRLHSEIGSRGLLLSEFDPGQHAFRGSFPQRNRLIAGLSELTIVVEAGYKSGAIGTAMHARDASRDVAAVPGSIDAPQSAGCNALIRDGAHPITCVNDALALMRLAPEPEDVPPLRPVEEVVWKAIGMANGAPIELLVAQTGLELRDVLTTITSLELSGLVYMDPGGSIRRR